MPTREPGLSGLPKLTVLKTKDKEILVQTAADLAQVPPDEISGRPMLMAEEKITSRKGAEPQRKMRFCILSAALRLCER
jgi:hypothetical protein